MCCDNNRYFFVLSGAEHEGVQVTISGTTGRLGGGPMFTEEGQNMLKIVSLVCVLIGALCADLAAGEARCWLKVYPDHIECQPVSLGLSEKVDSFIMPVRLIAHRGFSGLAPENTIPAFRSAVEMDIDVIETDIHITKDGRLVIWHDPTLERNTDGKGRIEDHTISELRQFDAGYTFSADGGKTFPFRGKGVRICTLDEALEECPDERFNIDLKTKSSR